MRSHKNVIGIHYWINSENKVTLFKPNLEKEQFFSKKHKQTGKEQDAEPIQVNFLIHAIVLLILFP